MLPSKVSIVEVGPRDGLQNETLNLSAAQKIELINLLSKTGLKRIEAGSFVSPKWVPQMANSDEVFQALPSRTDVQYSALTPNLRGLETAIDAGVKEVAVFGSASEAFSQKNINCSISESLKRFEDVFQLADQNNIKVRGYVSCVMGCPYQGDISPKAVTQVSKALLDMGCYEISLGDTIGAGTPRATSLLLEDVLKDIPAQKLAAHFHDTYGQALVNLYKALEYGIATIDSAVAGLGGCPYAKGASGNVATEDVVYMLNGMEISSGVNMDRLLTASSYISEVLGRPPVSKAANALLAK
ncbi:hydroxymethylglutaryl-CoA lyase [Alteromonas mediterranea]|jgi:hydroxymethylglutaryl-CoA lyase|uniref:hydroxymethylglutaryl-CoA lyase n=1 Tax=Alteromonas mediterranea TaxID=314275 RepID=A0AAC8XJ55_9ALTE|nr:hydroxymethylglutaryl-CoA lyase [Alteromonas mediterranea]MBR9784107.1 hydroxymethylglutaryl-CoA lyase [Gammaproteobacteria bacterium]AGP97214.1 hydroxymethylglutaryl-CoA lyase [Alteromonas mediterranea UM7]AGQ01562.1 hydroxymethylglutaryl-CoA lyase [Alteromonas mediterranea UM4b]AMJ78302.1 hydroxymethylglutaryl-CoA lyase [Alteromonas mediterranea]AMJ82451.1 hydroxymethylglutaryl-CoA lyase [Alteromonas mediterranea]|tara:strand:- start:2715 stop:3611 length:897 start_codon:yes stop_codon:yes gene_type:complete